MITIKYAGIPGNGLVISKNKLGQRTFFADHWPDRAHHWLPCNDHPGDKASVEFIVTAPDHYQVVSNGIQIEETNLSDNTKLTHWKETQPLPMKIAVIGVARFAVHHAGDVNGIPVQSWVYPEMKQWGFQDYAIATDILKWFIDYVGPYPYKKLANVQSKTIFGGMENASAIFYHEGSVDGKKSEEALIAHEIAHQWFGNMATEKDFSHLWLSEGFATYLTDVYLESKYGRDSARRKLQGERRTVINFAKRNTKPVVDPKTPYMQLLNANSYQKGAWFLHMLRNKIGDSAFHRTIRAYYARFAGKNANTDDFRRVAEENSRQRLEPFFRQWLYTAGHPVLKITWEHKSSDKVLLLHSKQEQEAAFEFPLEIDIITTKGKIRKSILIDPKTISTTIKNIDGDVKEVILDPDTNLLFEGSIQRR